MNQILQCLDMMMQTAYTKEHPTNAQTYLCVQCCYALGIDPFVKPKKAAVKKAVKKQDRAKIVHYEQRRGVNSLGDICIQVNVFQLYRRSRSLTPMPACRQIY